MEGSRSSLSVKAHEQIHTVGSHCFLWMGSRPGLMVTAAACLPHVLALRLPLPSTPLTETLSRPCSADVRML